MGAMARRTVWMAAAGLLAWAPGAAAQATRVDSRAERAPAASPSAIPDPDGYLGFTLGSDRHLADWKQISGYFEALAEASARVRLDTLGKTTLGRPFIMLTIAEPGTLAHLERYREIQRKLADPRLVQGEAEAERLISEDKAVVLITAAIHSTEVGGSQVPLRIAYRLATSNTPEDLAILHDVILLLIPNLNPDGTQMVVDWYRSTLGQPWEGASPPFLYHWYTGHDDNRDWYAFTQTETRLTVEKAYNVWHPQIVHDIHQQGSEGSRFFLPPFMDPWEPNVDPILTEGVNQLGSYMAWRVGQEGLPGVVINSTYDAWTPARAYQHYHGAVRILSETASADMATPITVPFDSLRRGRGFDAREATWNFPDPWPGGEWHLSDILRYQEAGAFALLDNAAENREYWLRSFYRVGRKAVAGWKRWPEAWVVPAVQADSTAVAELLRILTTAQVEVRRAESPFTAGGRRYPAGTYVIPMRQPYASFAQAVLERQDYPDLRLYPGGPPKPPYDVTAQTLPLLLGVEAVQARDLEPGPDALSLSAPIATPEVRTVAEGLSRGTTPRPPRIAVYQSYAPSMDEGWTRWVLDRYRIPFTTVHDGDVRAGGLAGKYDAVILPSESSVALYSGRRPGTLPEKYTGGLGEAGTSALLRFVQDGGTLITLEEASRYAIDHLGVPLTDVVAGLPPREFYIPGSILSLDLVAADPLTAGMPAHAAAWFGRRGMAFAVRGDSARILARYGASPTLLSGWALGGEKVAGQGALVDVPVGRGRVVLFGFEPQYRGQPMATFPLLFNALRRSVRGEPRASGP